MFKGELFTAEYSIKQDAFHVDTVARSSLTNIELIKGNCDTGYIMIGIFDDRKEAHDMCQKMRSAMLGAKNGE